MCLMTKNLRINLLTDITLIVRTVNLLLMHSAPEHRGTV